MDNLTLLGVAIYAFALVLSGIMLRKTAGQRMEALFLRGERDHHAMARAFRDHPYGGSWKEHLRWLEEKGKSAKS